MLALSATPVQAAFPGENGKIAFASWMDGDTDIYLVNPDGTGLQNLTNNSPSEDSQPAWSPTGKEIAFIRHAGPRDRFDIWVMNADGTSQRPLTSGASNNLDPSWAPDGDRIAFASNRGPLSGFDVYVMRSDGSEIENLTNRPGHDRYPSWSPRGDRIAFAGLVQGEPLLDREILLMDTDGSGIVNLTNSRRDDVEPDWAPDASRIAFASARTFNHQIYAVSPPEIASTRLTIESTIDRGPSWSPDGRKITFERSTFIPDMSGIWVMDADGGQPTRITPLGFDTAWQPLPFKNASQKCKAFPGDYRNHGQCVKANK